MRRLLPVIALLLAASAAVAQSGKPTRRPDLVAAPQRPPLGFPIIRPPFWGGYWGGFYSDLYVPGLFPQPQVVILPQAVPVPVAPPNPARIAEDADKAAALAAATLTLELPAAADVWLDGDKQPSSTDTARTLSSPAMKLGTDFTFRVRAQWVENGTTYEAKQTTTVRAGERGKLTVYAGTPVK
jgi:uncharacterized protein (TIGR03000 family)